MKFFLVQLFLYFQQTYQVECRIKRQIDDEDFQRVYVDCVSLNTRELPTNIPDNAYDLKLSYNNLNEYCGLPAELDPIHQTIQFDIEEGSGNDNETLPEIQPFFNQSNFKIDRYDSLRRIELSYNPLKKICDYGFTMSRQVETIILTNTHVSEISNRTLAGLARLNYAELNYNQISKIYPFAFENSTNLEVLEVANNLLTNLTEHTFKNCPKLKQLHFQNNQIIGIHPTTFNGLSSLNYLNLNNNKLQSIQKGTFNNLTSLQYLLLNNNQLTTIWDGTLRTLDSLTTLDLSNNLLENISPRAFSTLNQLTYVTLKNNRIEVVYPRWFEAGQISKHPNAAFNLQQNKWTCSCQAVSFKLWLSQNTTSNVETAEKNNRKFFFRVSNITEATGLKCGHPSHIARQDFSLDSMDNSWFPESKENATSCTAPKIPNDKKRVYTLSFFEKTTIEIQCLAATGYPKPHVFWTTPGNETYFSTDGRLVKEHATSSDDGEYVCEIVNVAGVAKIVYNVHIYWEKANIDCLGNYLGGTSNLDSSKLNKLNECNKLNLEEVYIPPDKLSIADDGTIAEDYPMAYPPNSCSKILFSIFAVFIQIIL